MYPSFSYPIAKEKRQSKQEHLPTNDHISGHANGKDKSSIVKSTENWPIIRRYKELKIYTETM